MTRLSSTAAVSFWMKKAIPSRRRSHLKRIFSSSISPPITAQFRHRNTMKMPLSTMRWCWERATTCASVGFRRRIVGLSGGIDSALVATIAAEALGAENVLGVGMPSEYSSQGSIDDARQLAQNLGIQWELIPINDIFQQHLKALQPILKTYPPDITEENLQSRIRGALLMALSNKLGALVLTTGNKSEMSTGYCTLYGDMVGALAVIADVYKTCVYRLARYANREREIIPENTLVKATVGGIASGPTGHGFAAAL